MTTEKKEALKTPPVLQAELDGIFKAMRKNPVIRKMGTDLVSKLRSEIEGRGKVPVEVLDQYRAAFQAAVAAVMPRDNEE